MNKILLAKIKLIEQTEWNHGCEHDKNEIALRKFSRMLPRKMVIITLEGLEKLVHHFSILFLVFLHFCFSFPWSFSDLFSFLASLCVAPFLFQISAFLFLCLTLLIPFNEQQSLDQSNSPCSFDHFPTLSLLSAPSPPYPLSLLLDLRMSNVWDSRAIAAVLSQWGLPPPRSE